MKNNEAFFVYFDELSCIPSGEEYLSRISHGHHQNVNHSDIRGVIPNKLRRMIYVNPDEKMKQQMKDYAVISKKYGFVMYDTLDEAMSAEAELLPSEVPTWVGGSMVVDIKKCLLHLFKCEPEALQLMEEVYDEMEQNGEILNQDFMKAKSG